LREQVLEEVRSLVAEFGIDAIEAALDDPSRDDTPSIALYGIPCMQPKRRKPRGRNPGAWTKTFTSDWRNIEQSSSSVRATRPTDLGSEAAKRKSPPSGGQAGSEEFSSHTDYLRAV
jgi:hypothetical protein